MNHPMSIARSGRVPGHLRTQQAMLVHVAVTAALTQADLASTLCGVTEAAAWGLSCELASIWLHTSDPATLSCLDLYCRSLGLHSRGARLPTRHFPRYAAALFDATDEANDPAHGGPFPPPPGHRRENSSLDVPIVLHGQRIGVLCVEHTDPSRRFSADEQSFVEELSEMIARALDVEAHAMLENTRRSTAAPAPRAYGT